MSNSNIGRVDLYNMSREGQVSFRSSFDTWDDTELYSDPWDLVVSSKGNYVFFYDWDSINGVVYHVDTEYSFRFLSEIQNGCLGGGFSLDEKYLFTVTDRYTTTPTLATYFVQPDSADLLTTQGVARNEIISENYVVTSLLSKTTEIQERNSLMAGI